MIYLDNAATTQIDNDVLESMMPWLNDQYGNAGSIHSLGRAAREAVENARTQVAALINAEPEQIIFTSGGSEANTMALTCQHDHPASSLFPQILTTDAEHDSVRYHIEEVYIPDNILKVPIRKSDSGTLEYQVPDFDISKVGMVAVMLANNEVNIGRSIEFEKLIHSLHEQGVVVFADAVQAFGSTTIDVKDSHVAYDILSFSGHKIHAPKGVGALYVRDKEMLYPLIGGSTTQEFGLRSGTENVAGIVGFGKACDLEKNHHRRRGNRRMMCAEHFYDELLRSAQQLRILDRIHANGNPIGKVSSYTINGVDAQSLILMCDARGLCISAGSACANHQDEPSHVLLAIGLTEQQARSTIRVSFSHMNSVRECVQAAKIVAESAKILLEGE